MPAASARDEDSISALKSVAIDGRRIAYREAGHGSPIG
jgi:hypothetical protein